MAPRRDQSSPFQPDPAFVADVESALLARSGRARAGEIITTCIRPEAHARGDAHPSLRYSRSKHAYTCDACGVGAESSIWRRHSASRFRGVRSMG